MSTFQTLLALVVLIFVLSVIVRAVHEVLKSLLDTKANTMAEMITRFMGTTPRTEGRPQKTCRSILSCSGRASIPRISRRNPLTRSLDCF